MVDVAPFLVVSFGPTTLYALWFLLGSQAVAGLSDLRRMAAQREFMEVWIAFVVVLLGIDVWFVYGGREAWLLVAVKWGLLAIVGVLSWRKVGGLFRLARGDVWAILAVGAILNPLFIVIFVVLLKLSDIVMRPGLRAFGSGDAYPFIPVVVVATLATVGLIVIGLMETLLERMGVL